MRPTKYEVISFFATTAIFCVVFTCFCGWPNTKSSMGSGTSAPSNSTELQKFIYAQAIDNLNGVNVYYNGKIGTVTGRSIAPDGYNFGLKYQCVEFVKRYYYEYYKHKMPDSHGHAKDFYDPAIPDGWMNQKRNLRQFSNGSISRPRIGDILVFAATKKNKYGHIGIISKSGTKMIQMVHQNAGPGNESRVIYKLQKEDNLWYINNDQVIGWLRRS